MKRCRTKKYKDGTAWASGASNAVSGIGSAISAYGATDDEYNNTDKFGSVLSSAGGLAAAGSAFGPIGAVAGGLIGGAIGLIGANKQEEQYKLRKKREVISGNLSSLEGMNLQARAESINNPANYRVAGFKNGTSSFSNSRKTVVPNAKIANEEGIRDPRTGLVDVVPGVYDSSNPDKVSASLAEGTSIYPNNRSLPGGKSSPAKIIARMKRVQDSDSKMMNGKTIANPIDRRTAMLNKKNIAIQSELLNMDTIINNYSRNMQTGSYDDGTGYFIPMTDNKTPYNRVNLKKMRDSELSLFWDSDNKQWVRRASENTPGARRLAFTDNGYGDMVLSKRVSDAPTQPIDNSAIVQDQTGTVATSAPQAPIQTSASSVQIKVPGSTGNTFSGRINVGSGETAASKMVEVLSNAGYSVDHLPREIADGALLAAGNKLGRNRNGYLNYNPGDYNFTVDLSKLGLKGDAQSSSSTGNDNSGASSTQSTTAVDGRAQQAKTNGNTAPLKVDISRTLFGGQTSNPEDKDKISTDVFKSSVADKIGSFGSDLMSLSPTIYNLFNNQPEVAKPIYDRNYNPIIRANISKNIEDARRQRQIARYNNRVMNSGAGIGMQFGSNIYSAGVETLNNIMQNADNQNNQYRIAAANSYNQNASANAAEDRRIYDLNSRNRAAARSMTAKGIEQLSQYAQTKELIKNQKKSDILNSKIWSVYANNINPDIKAGIDSDLGISQVQQKKKIQKKQKLDYSTYSVKRPSVENTIGKMYKKNSAYDPNTYIPLTNYNI